MAEFDPRDATKAPGFNTWGYAGVPKENAVYDFLDTVKESTDAIFEVVNFTFDLINSFLDFIASLLIDFSNPLKIIIDEIIALLEGFMTDLRNLGLYITFDNFKRENLAEKMLGGYPAFEQRMVKKLLNNSDRSRPNFTPQTKVFAMTLFAGADASGIKKVITAFEQLRKLLGSGQPNQVAKAPVNVEAVFYNDLVGEVELSSSFKPDGVKVKWKLPPPDSTNRAFPSAFILPDYFLFSVSTRKADDLIGLINSVDREASDPKVQEGKPKKIVSENTVFGQYADARLWKLYGAQNSISKLPEDKDFHPLEDAPNNTLTKSFFDFSWYKYWVLVNGDDIYSTRINGQKISEVYNMFIYEAGGDAVIGDDDFSFNIPFDNIKIDGQLADEYHITMYSMDAEKLPALNKTDLTGTLRTGLQAQINGVDLDSFFIDPKGGRQRVLIPRPKEGISNLSLPSNTFTIKAPSDLKTKYLKAVRFFFLGYALSTLNGNGAGTLGITFTKEENDFIKRFTKSDDGIEAIQKSTSLNKQLFSKELLEWVDDIMINFKHLLPSEGSFTREQVRHLNEIAEFKYDFYEILSSGASGKSEGLFPNWPSWYNEIENKFTPRVNLQNVITPEERRLGNYSTSIEVNDDAVIVFDNEDGTTTTSTPEYNFKSFLDDTILNDVNPVIFYRLGDLKYFGSVAYIKDFKENMVNAKSLIMLSNQSDEEGQWFNLKPFRETDLSSILDFIDDLKRVLESLTRGLEGIVAQILKYIHLLKTRIAQIQAVIARIKALVDLILSFRFPAGLYGTFHLADGTSGLVNSLVNSKDKPAIGPEGYGLGMMMVGGGVPSLLVDFFIALIGGDSSQEGG